MFNHQHSTPVQTVLISDKAVLCHRKHKYHPWVVWSLSKEKNVSGGHYFAEDQFSRALKEFEKKNDSLPYRYAESVTVNPSYT